MANYNDLEEAFFKSSMETSTVLMAQKVVFKRLAANIGGIGYWPTTATQKLFDEAVQRYIERTVNAPKPASTV